MLKDGRNAMNTIIAGTSSSYSQRIQILILVLGLLAILGLFASGCATAGKDFPVTRVSEIEPGKTTQKEIRLMFGAPWRVGIENGQRTWTYGNYRYILFSEKSAKDLVIRFDDRDVVSSYTFNTTEHSE